MPIVGAISMLINQRNRNRQARVRITTRINSFCMDLAAGRRGVVWSGREFTERQLT